MVEERLYRVIISDRAKRMLGTHIRFLAKVSKSAATEKKQQLLQEILERLQRGEYMKFQITANSTMVINLFHRTNTISCMWKTGILSCIRSVMILSMWTTFWTAGRNIAGCSKHN